jgi:hypothetical protein
MTIDFSKANTQILEDDTRLGIYVWEIDGKWVGDDDGNFLSISSMKNDKSRIELLQKAVRGYGVDRGEPVFLAGRRKINDEEFAYQQSRLNLGLVPDPLDIGSYKDDLKNLGNLRG